MTDPSDRFAALADRYRIDRELGAGGMATVYLADDLRHDRKVALKVLRPELAAAIGPARFLAEIKTTANLQHPHILALHDSGEADGTVFYVMPFVQGESLRDRLDRETQLPIADAVRIASEVAEALDYAHRQGVIHRDIKPENILLHDGRALVADFGIALAAAGGADRMTETGMSLGTPHYMSPEQAMGERDLDGRTDIYALGCVLYEMLAGEPPFDGPTAQAIVARVMASDPDRVTTLRRTVPPSLEAAVHTAIQKLPADRFPTAREMAATLTGAATAPHPSAAARARSLSTGRWLRDPRTLALAGIAIATLIWGTLNERAEQATTRHATRRTFLPMASNQFDVRAPLLALSADGRVMAVDAGGAGILVRSLADMHSDTLVESGQGERPFLSDDGTRVGYLLPSDVVLQRIDGGGRSRYNFPGLARFGAAFFDEQRLVMVDSAGLALFDPTTQAIEIVVPARAGWEYHEPHPLPGRRRILFTAMPEGLGTPLGLAVDLQTARVDTLARQALSIQYADGWLFYARPSGAITALRYDVDAGRPEGTELALGDVAMINRTATAAFAAARGVLVYGERQPTRLVAIAESGQRTVLTEEEALYHAPRASPDGRRVTFDVDAGGIGGRDVWMLDLATGSRSRVTNVGDGHDPTWTPDSRGITFISFVGRPGLYTAPADGGALPVPLLPVSGTINPGMWLEDGRRYLFGFASSLAGDLGIVTVPDGTIDTLLATPFDEHSPALSPDESILAYTSDEAGQPQVYVRNLDGVGGRTVVSLGSGEEPMWKPAGDELYFVEHLGDRSRLRAARIEPGAPPSVTGYRTVFEDFRSEPVGNHSNWDVMSDGRFLVVEPVGGWMAVMVFDWSPEGE